MTLGGDERPDRDASRRAYETYRLPLLRLCVLLVGDPVTAEDIVQDVFVRTIEKIGGLPDEEVGPYLRRSVVNAWKNRARHLRVEASAVPKLARDDADEGAAMDNRDAMWREIAKLPPRQRACVVLRYYEDLPDREIAEVLGCRVGTVKSQSSRAIAKLRRAIEP